MAEIYACAECGTEDETVAPGGTALCYLCAELSALQAPAKERRWRRRVLIARFTGLALVAAAAIWLIVWSVLRGGQYAEPVAALLSVPVLPPRPERILAGLALRGLLPLVVQRVVLRRGHVLVAEQRSGDAAAV
jgi:hypothetical protein